MPLPDIVLTSEPHGEGPIPLPSIALVVEVSSTTLRRDLGKKAPIYATGNIPEYWIADINARVIHQLWSPAGNAYSAREKIASGEMLTARSIPGLTIATTSL